MSPEQVAITRVSGYQSSNQMGWSRGKPGIQISSGKMVKNLATFLTPHS